MLHEKIYKLEDGSRLKVLVRLVVDSVRETIEYRASAYTAAQGKRNFTPILNEDEFSYRNMSMEERREFANKQIFEVVGEERILEVKLELWESFRPTIKTPS